jgi:Uma2 family endonuclease
MGSTTRVSIDEYLSYQAPAGFRDELVGGELVLSPDPKPIHADVAKQLDMILTAALRGSRFLVRQRINMLLKDDESMPSPDVFVLDKTRWQEARDQNKYPVGSPQLAIEIQSPSNSRPRLRTKIELYLKNGSFAVWVIYPAKQTVVVFTESEEAEYRMGESVPLPGALGQFALLVENIFKNND